MGIIDDMARMRANAYNPADRVQRMAIPGPRSGAPEEESPWGQAGGSIGGALGTSVGGPVGGSIGSLIGSALTKFLGSLF